MITNSFAFNRLRYSPSSPLVRCGWRVHSKPLLKKLDTLHSTNGSAKGSMPGSVHRLRAASEPNSIQDRGHDEPNEDSNSGDSSSGDNTNPGNQFMNKLPKWPLQLLSILATGQVEGKTANPVIVRLLRASFLFTIGAFVMMSREAVVAKARLSTQEVMYSTFVQLLDSGRVRAARLESAANKMYFDLKPMEEPSTMQSTQPVAGSAQEDTVVSAEGAGSVQPSQATPGTGQEDARAKAVRANSGTLKQPNPVKFQRQFIVKLADKTDPALISRILLRGVEFAVIKQSFAAALGNILMSSLTIWVPLMPVLLLLRGIIEERTGNAGRKKKDDGKAHAVHITFDDVAGVNSAREELMEVVSVMKAQRSAYSKLRVKMPSGVLLCGPPGTGKTLLAKAVAGEAGIPFLACSASEFVEMFVGRGAARIRELFAEARKNAPCVVFIDELDAVGARRGMGYNDERDQTLNQLLTELDGFDGRQGVLFLAATNRVDVLDPALLRPGRISRKVVVPLPDMAGRRDILSVHLRNVPMESLREKDEACEQIAHITSGFSGAELANVVNEAALLAARKNQEVVTSRELIEGLSRTKYGVNGQTKTSSKLLQWVVDVATRTRKDPRVKNATA